VQRASFIKPLNCGSTRPLPSSVPLWPISASEGSLSVPSVPPWQKSSVSAPVFRSVLKFQISNLKFRARSSLLDILHKRSFFCRRSRREASSYLYGQRKNGFASRNAGHADPQITSARTDATASGSPYGYARCPTRSCKWNKVPSTPPSIDSKIKGGSARNGCLRQ